MSHTHSTISTAYTIALINLRNSYQKDGIYAGKTHFADIWARDSLFASFGALSVKDYRIVKRNLQTLIRYMNKDGQIPLRVGQKYFLFKYLGIQAKKEPRFTEDKEVSTPVDSNSLLMIVFQRYLEETKDFQFAINYFEKLKKIIDWNFTQDKDQDLLIEEGGYAGWADSLNKKGKVLYTNVLHFKALHSFASICHLIKRYTEAKAYFQLAENVKDRINDIFWEDHYYVDQVHHNKRFIFSTDGNLMAILFGITSELQARQIMQTIDTFQMEKDFCIKTNYPNYTAFEIFFPFHIIRLQDYHNGLIWLWLGCINAATQHMIGDQQNALECLNRISEKIIEYHGIYEVYHKGKPVKRFFYKSEQGFAWSAGLFVWAFNQLGLKES